MNNEKKLENFNLVIDEILNARYILSDIKIGKLLALMAEDDEIYHLLVIVLKGFSFENESHKYLLGDIIELPTKPRDVLAFVFCLLVNLHDRQINFYDFLRQYYLSDNINASYDKFVKSLILPFQRIIIETIEGEGEKNLGPAPKTLSDVLFDICREIQNNCDKYKGTVDAYIILDGMLDAAKRNNLKLFDSLKNALLNSTKNKKFKQYVLIKLAEAYE